jgi:hypothetical protein
LPSSPPPVLQTKVALPVKHAATTSVEQQTKAAPVQQTKVAIQTTTAATPAPKPAPPIQQKTPPQRPTSLPAQTATPRSSFLHGAMLGRPQVPAKPASLLASIASAVKRHTVATSPTVVSARIKMVSVINVLNVFLYCDYLNLEYLYTGFI